MNVIGKFKLLVSEIPLYVKKILNTLEIVWVLSKASAKTED